MPTGPTVHECPEEGCDAWFLTDDGVNGHQTKHGRDGRDDLPYGVTD